MKTPLLTNLILLSCWVAPAQYNSAAKTQNWNNIISVSKMEGTHTSGLQFSYLKNTNYWWNDWLIPLSFSFQTKEIQEETFLESPYLSVTKTQGTLGFSGYKPLAPQWLLNVEVGVILGNEILVDLFNRRDERFVFGLGSSQGVMFVPSSQWGIVLQAGIYEDIVNSKLYTFDVGVHIGAGFRFQSTLSPPSQSTHL